MENPCFSQPVWFVQLGRLVQFGSVLVHQFGLLLVGSTIESGSVSPIVMFYFMICFVFNPSFIGLVIIFCCLELCFVPRRFCYRPLYEDLCFYLRSSPFGSSWVCL